MNLNQESIYGMTKYLVFPQGKKIINKQIVEQFMFANFHAGTPTIEETALYFKTNSVRLESMIKIQGSSFNKLQDKVTKTIATNLIRRNLLDIDLIGHVLGFSNYDHFKSKLCLWYNTTSE